MKEKNDIDILEELQICCDSDIGISKECFTAISNLISENKELKEENNVLKQEKEYLECIIASDEDNYIPKSKVEEKIQNIDYRSNCKQERIAMKQILQELLDEE